MNSGEATVYRLVRCERHGSNREAFVCEHLFLGAGLKFFSDVDDPSNPCPDAWCSGCELLKGESATFSDEYARATFKLVCAVCYEEIKAKHMTGPGHSTKVQ